MKRSTLLLFIGLQISIFFAMQLGLHIRFASNPGTVALVRPLQNLETFWNHPLYTMIHIGIGAAVLCAMLINWHRKPAHLRTAFITLFPPLLIGYLLFGWAYEIRVFIEVYPVMALLAMPIQQSKVIL